MARWSSQRFDKELRAAIQQAEEVGIDVAVGAFSARLLADHPVETVRTYVELLGTKHGIKGDDAIAAARMYNAHILSKFPWFIRALWPIMGRLVPKWIVESSSRRVVIRTPYSKGQIICPVIRAVDGDLTKARPICEALFRHDAFADPLSTLVAKAVNPQIRWEIHEYRTRPNFPCYYAIVLDP